MLLLNLIEFWFIIFTKATYEQTHLVILIFFFLNMVPGVRQPVNTQLCLFALVILYVCVMCIFYVYIFMI